VTHRHEKEVITQNKEVVKHGENDKDDAIAIDYNKNDEG
jgi:hypothetical protein